MGMWPLLHLHSFGSVTGAKTDKWLVKSIAWMFIVIGLQLWVADQPKDVVTLGLGSAAAVAGLDVYYSLTHRISNVYLLDAVVQLGIIVWWLIELWGNGPSWL